MKRLLLAAALLCACENEVTCEKRWVPEPEKEDLRACIIADRAMFYCLTDLGYKQVCK
jgi:hypothetical protein